MKHLLPLIACLMSLASTASTVHAADVDLAVHPLKPAFARGEPVVLEISLANRGDQDATVDLGARHFAKVTVHVRAPAAAGAGQVCTLKPQEGFHEEYKPVVVTAHGIWESRRTLDDFSRRISPEVAREIAFTYRFRGVIPIEPNAKAICFSDPMTIVAMGGVESEGAGVSR